MLAIDLDAVSTGIGHEYPALVIHLNRYGSPEGLLPFQPMGHFSLLPHVRIGIEPLYAPLGESRIPIHLANKSSLTIKDLQPVITPVGDLN